MQQSRRLPVTVPSAPWLERLRLVMQLLFTLCLQFYDVISDVLLAYGWYRQKHMWWAYIVVACILVSVSLTVLKYLREQRCGMALLSVVELNLLVLAWRSLQEGRIVEELAADKDIESIFEAGPQLFLQAYVLLNRWASQTWCRELSTTFTKGDYAQFCSKLPLAATGGWTHCCRYELVESVYQSERWQQFQCEEVHVSPRAFERERGGSCPRGFLLADAVSWTNGDGQAIYASDLTYHQGFSFLETTSPIASLLSLAYTLTGRTRKEYPKISILVPALYFAADLLTYCGGLALLSAFASFEGTHTNKFLLLAMVGGPVLILNWTVSLCLRTSSTRREALLVGALTSIISPVTPMPAISMRVPRRALLIVRMMALHISGAILWIGLVGVDDAKSVALGAAPFLFLTSLALATGLCRHNSCARALFLLCHLLLMSYGVVTVLGVVLFDTRVFLFQFFCTAVFFTGAGPLVQEVAGMHLAELQEEQDDEELPFTFPFAVERKPMQLLMASKTSQHVPACLGDTEDLVLEPLVEEWEEEPLPEPEEEERSGLVASLVHEKAAEREVESGSLSRGLGTEAPRATWPQARPAPRSKRPSWLGCMMRLSR